MQNHNERSPDRESEFYEVFLSRQDYQQLKKMKLAFQSLGIKYKQTQKQRQIEAIEAKQQLKKVMRMAKMTIELQEENLSLKNKYRRKLSEVAKQNEKSVEKLQRDLEDLKVLMAQKDEEILRLKTNLQQASNTKQQLILTRLQTETTNRQTITPQQTQTKFTDQTKSLDQQIEYYRYVIKQLNSKLIGISMKLHQIKKNNFTDKYNGIEMPKGNHKNEEDFNSIIMEEDDIEVRLVVENLNEVENSLNWVLQHGYETIKSGCTDCHDIQQQAALLQRQNTALLSRLSIQQHESPIQLTLQVIHKKYQKILETTTDKYEVNQQMYKLMKNYQKAIEDQYDQIVLELFKNDLEGQGHVQMRKIDPIFCMSD